MTVEQEESIPASQGEKLDFAACLLAMLTDAIPPSIDRQGTRAYPLDIWVVLCRMTLQLTRA